MVRAVWVGGGLLAVSMGCSALSLGMAQGQVLIGRPLDVSIPLLLNDGESVADACASAQVFWGDEPVSSAGVKTGVVASSQPHAATVRVQTAAPIVEMFARIELQVGCGQRLTRAYVLLADPAPVAAPPESQAVVSKTALLPASAPASAAQFQAVKPVKPVTVPLSTRKPKGSVEPTNATPKAVAAAPAPQMSRLSLDPLELVATVNQLQPSLRLSVDPPADPVEDADLAQRRQAARLLWQTLNNSPDPLVANALKTEADRAKAELAAAQQIAQAAQAQLLEEQESRYTDPLFFGLLAALLAALLGLAVVWRRQYHDAASQASPWWTSKPLSAQAEDVTSSPVATLTVLDRIKALLKTEFSVGKVPFGRRRSKESVSKFFEESTFSTNAAASPSAPNSRFARGHADFAKSSMFEMARSVATEELFDLQQQVEFFISLDQADEAIGVLQAHLRESSDPSPLAYLDLLKLHHDLGQRREYAALQVQFNHIFNGHAPDFDRYSNSDGGLERYQSALSRIQALWPEPAVLQLIERSIFRDASGDASDVFDLEAYRELLLLYGIARELIDEQPPVAQASQPLTHPDKDSVQDPDSSFKPTVSEPLPVGVVFEPIAVLPDANVLSGSRCDLDLDLSVTDEPDVPDAGLPSGELAMAKDDLAANASSHRPALDLDFSDLDDAETFTIKKSGQPTR